jgi:U3 small nucleolar ribonucleoprotein component
MKNLFYQLDQLSNLHFTPRPADLEAKISTQNVPSLMIEDAIPIAVNASG